VTPCPKAIVPPPRCGPAEAVVVLVIAGLHAGFMIVRGPGLLALGSLLTLLTVFSAVRRHPQALHVSLLTLLLIPWQWVWPSGWPLYLAGPVLIYLLLAQGVPSLRTTLGWLRVGRLDAPVWLLMGLTVVFSAMALIAWFVLSRPNVATWANLTRNWPVGLLIVGGLGFSIANAAVEEAVYRGVLMQGLDAAVGPGYLSAALQAVPFGLIHLRGVPNGALGIVMAAAYGLMLGLVRRRSGGMMAPFIAHILADAVIVTLLALCTFSAS
jgi:uncharacterized protein